jgi:hypothetical protein
MFSIRLGIAARVTVLITLPAHLIPDGQAEAQTIPTGFVAAPNLESRMARKSIAPTNAAPIVINEIVTDPQQDWNDATPFDNVPGTGAITDVDEWLELFNAGSVAINLREGAGWRLDFIDTTPDSLKFSSPGSTVRFVFSKGGTLTNFQPGEYLVIGNPPGAMNNDIFLVLKNSAGMIIDDVELGDDAEGDGAGDGAPDGGPGGGDATGINNEAIARLPNAIDTDDDVADFAQQAATIGASNDPVVCVNYDFPVAGSAWYLLSLPVIPANKSVSALFPAATAAFGWDFINQTYVAVTSLEPERAYWLLMPQAATVQVCGAPLKSYTHTYTTPGWDLTGSVVQTSPLSANPTGSVLAMFRWDSPIQLYVAITPNQVEPQQGYWIAVSSVPSTVTVGGSGSVGEIKK